MPHPITPPAANPRPGTDGAAPELLLVRRSSGRPGPIETWLDGLTWPLRVGYGLDHALDLLRQHPPSVVLVDQISALHWNTDLLGWLGSVCTVLPVIMVCTEMDPDQVACLRGLGVFELVMHEELGQRPLAPLLAEALSWGVQTGRRRQPAPSALLTMEWTLDGRLDGVSEPLAQALCWPAAELIGQDLGRVVAPASLQLRDHWMRPGTQRLQLLRRDGTRWSVTVIRQPVLGPQGQPVRILGEFAGLTTRLGQDGWSQRRVLLVAQKLKAERISQAKSRFMAAISHDLRQPMHALGLFVEELRRTCREPDAQAVVEHMSMSLNSMSSLLDSVLALSRLEAEELVPSLMPFPIDPMLERLRVAYRGAAQEKGLRFVVGTSTARVVSDPSLLERMLNNLVANAVQYTARGGVLVTCRQRQERLRIQVWDTGVGIPAAELDAVFREFYRVEHEQVAHEGAGLGLSIVRSCATVLGLPVGLRSEVGRGSCFSLDIPLAPPEDPDQPPVPMVQEETTWEPDGPLTRTLLLVDADGSSGPTLRPLLQSWGCRVIPVMTLRAAQIAASQIEGGPHLLIGVLSPGAETLIWSTLRSLRAGTRPSLPAVVITTDTSLHAAREARLHRVVLLNRPVAPARLYGLIGSFGGSD